MRMILARRAGVLACAALLAGLCGCLVNNYRCDPLVVCKPGCGPSADCPAEDEQPLTDLGGFGFRPFSFLQRTGFKVEDLPYLKHFQAKVGIPLPKIDTFAVVCFDGEKRALLVRTSGDINQGNVMMACEAGDLMPTRKPDACAPKVYTGKSGLAVHFPSPKEALITDSPATMAHCLKQLPALTEHLDKAGEADVSVWGRAVAMNKPERKSCYRAVGSLLLPGVHTAAKVAPPKAEEETTFDFLPIPVPNKAKSGRVMLSLSTAASVTCEIEFADEASAKAAKAVVADYLEMGRGAVLMFVSELAVARHSPGLIGGFECASEKKELFDTLPLGLLKRFEKSMRDATVEAKGKRVTAAFGVPFNAEDRAACRKFLEKYVEVAGPETCGAKAGAGLIFEARGPVVEAESCVPAAPALPPGIETIPDLPPGHPGQKPVATVPPPPPAATWTLTVANVLKDGHALLFTVDPRGDLTFVAKVPPGEAVDLPAEKGQRWAATFMSEPYRAMHAVTGDKQVFLIRAAPVPLPTVSAPAGWSSSLSR